jgi:predicted nucleic acid-binding protein
VTLALDTNVLLDLLGGNDTERSSARGVLSQVGALVVCPIVYAELDAMFDRSLTTDRFLADLQVRLEDFATEALRRASVAWRAYTTRRGQRLQCSSCGHRFQVPCPACAVPVVWRQHLISDFLIGGHAATQTDGLITRDPGYFRTYFPEMALVVPAAP